MADLQTKFGSSLSTRLMALLVGAGRGQARSLLSARSGYTTLHLSRPSHPISRLEVVAACDTLFSKATGNDRVPLGRIEAAQYDVVADVPSSLVSSVFGTGPGKQESYTYKQMTITIAKELPQSILNSGVMSSSFLSDMQQQRYERVLLVWRCWASGCIISLYSANSMLATCPIRVESRVCRFVSSLQSCVSCA
mgnify:CR=1 FL=1